MPEESHRHDNHSRVSALTGDATVGAGDETVLGWVGQVVGTAWAQNHDVTIYNLGIRGDSTRDILRRWRRECDARLPRGTNGRLVFMFGGNDAKEIVGTGVEVPVEESVGNARTIIAEAAAWLPTLWLSLLPMHETKPYPRLLPRHA